MELTKYGGTAILITIIIISLICHSCNKNDTDKRCLQNTGGNLDCLK